MKTLKFPIIILYVADQKRSSTFYEIVLKQKPILDVPGMTEFMLNNLTKLGLMPENGISEIICPITANPATGNGIPRCELYLFVDNPEESLLNALNAGAVEISKTKMRDWGDVVAYCSDPDGHILGLAK